MIEKLRARLEPEPLPSFRPYFLSLCVSLSLSLSLSRSLFLHSSHGIVFVGSARICVVLSVLARSLDRQRPKKVCTRRDVGNTSASPARRRYQASGQPLRSEFACHALRGACIDACCFAVLRVKHFNILRKKKERTTLIKKFTSSLS